MHTENRTNYAMIGWLLCGLGAIFYSYEYLLRIAPSVMENALRTHFNLSASGFGFLSSIYYLAYVPMQLPVGVLLDRYGPKRLLTMACLVCVIGTYMFTGTTIFWVAATGRFLVGFGSAFAFVGVLKIATLWLPENRLAMISGMTSALGPIGAMLGDNFLELFIVKMGWVKTLNMTAAFGIVLTLVLWVGIKDRKGHHRQSGTVPTLKKGLVDLGIIITSRQIWVNGMYGCLVYLPTTVFAELWGIPYLHHAHGLTTQAAGLANSILFLGFIIGAPIMGYISDRLYRRKFPMLIGASGAAIVMMMILYLPGLNESNIQALMFLLGLLYSAQAIVFAVGRELSPGEAAGTAMAVTNMIVMLGAMFLQPLVGHLLDFSLSTHLSDATGIAVDNMSKLYTVDDYQFALSIIPLGILIAAILTFFLKETHAKAPK
ncbi:TPA: MFS transporter [Legionella pneumophila]|uniref:MFS transporter n=1 Tax=Legionella sp. PATHC032 TaxID=2992039 RepID=UPI001B224FC5|nr:MFS transporter [Legionella sp. PATHC032]MCW8420651.1 MFS transporter [Legionella sp. PATHC032]HAZ7573465.1 MFS transporter [Legionella pneumophila]HBA1636178.1 MFS transporter [Legionella pneumophila]